VKFSFVSRSFEEWKNPFTPTDLSRNPGDFGVVRL